MTERNVGTALRRWLCTGLVAAVPFVASADGGKAKVTREDAYQNAMAQKFGGAQIEKVRDINRLTTNKKPSWYVAPSNPGVRGGCVTCQPGDTIENEADCGLPIDTINGGCNSSPIVTQPIVCDQTYCGTFAFDGSFRDTDWFDFTVPGAPGTQMDVTVTGNAESDYVFGFTPTSCTGLLDTFFVGTACVEGSVTKCIPAGTTVYIVMLPQFLAPIACGDTLAGDWRMSVTCAPGSCPPPANDACADAVNIGVPSVTNGTTLNSNADGEAVTCGTTVDGAGVWYTIGGTGNTIVLSTCSFNTNYDTKLSVYCGDCTGGFSCVVGVDDDFNCPSDVFQSTVEWCSNTGTTYYVLVHGFGGATGDFELTASDGGACGNPVTCAPPANDDCLNAITLACGSTGVYSNAFATGAGDDPVYSCSFGGPSVGANTVWFKFVAADVSAQISLCPQLFPGLADSIVGVYSGSCGSLSELACNDDFCGLVSELCVEGLTVGQTYYVQVASWINSGSQGDFNLELVCPCPPPPPGDFCENAVPVAVPSSTSGDTTGSTIDTAPFCGTGITTAGVWYTVTGTGNTITASLCNAGSTFDHKLSVYCGVCSNLSCVTGIDDFCGLQPQVSWCSQAGATYYILVHGFGGTVGPFQLDILDDGVGCTATVQCLPQGACCLSPTNCVITTAPGCAGLGGAYQGDNTDCFAAGSSHNYSSAPNIPIPDSGLVTDSIAVGDNYTVAGVTVAVNIPDHTWIGDLIIRLSNGSTTVDVWNRQCGSNDGLTVTFDDAGGAVVCATPTTGTYAPFAPLAAFAGSSANATWTLEVSDNAGADIGTLADWTLTLVEAGPSICAGGGGCPNPGCADPGADADFNNDCRVDLTDLAILLANFGTGSGATNATGDTDGDGDVQLDDLARVLARFGNNCN